MTIGRSINGSSLTLLLEGRIDTNSAPLFEEAIFGALDGVNELILDFEKIDYISSAGLRVLLKAEKEMSRRGGMKLVRVGPSINDIFEVTGFCDFLTIE